MLKLNRKVEYGLVAMKHMRGKPMGELTSVREICDVYNTPFDPVAHVLRILNTEGIVKSEQGAHGGYRLTRDLSKVHLAGFIEMIEGRLTWTDCAKDEKERRCGISESCNISEAMCAFNDKLLGFLRSVTLSELLGDEGNSGGPGKKAGGGG